MTDKNKKQKKTTITLDKDVADRIRVATINSEHSTITDYVKAVMDKFEENGWRQK